MRLRVDDNPPSDSPETSQRLLAPAGPPGSSATVSPNCFLWYQRMKLHWWNHQILWFLCVPLVSLVKVVEPKFKMVEGRALCLTAILPEFFISTGKESTSEKDGSQREKEYGSFPL